MPMRSILTPAGSKPPKITIRFSHLSDTAGKRIQNALPCSCTVSSTAISAV